MIFTNTLTNVKAISVPITMKLKTIFLFLIVLIVLPNLIFAQEVDNPPKPDTLSKKLTQEEFMYANSYRHTMTGQLPNRETKIKPVTFSVISGLTVGFLVTQHIIQVNTIWSETTEFRFIEDGQYALYSDKAGHFFAGYLASSLFSEGFIASGLKKSHAAWVGSLLGLSYTTYVEIMDGFGENWGFSPTDFYADLAGTSFFLLQNYYPYLQNITPKFTYFPANWHGDLRRKEAEMFIDDYSSHTLWLSFNVHNMLPDNLKPYWPDWLALSVGYAARNLSLPGPDGINKTSDRPFCFDDLACGDRRFIVALDYDLMKIVPDCGPFCNWMVQTLNLFKFPAPAIEFADSGTRFMLLYPFPL